MYRPLIARLPALLFMVSVLASGCATTGPPVQEMSDARQAIAAAEEAGASQFDQPNLRMAEDKLAAAETQLQGGMYWNARKLALGAKEAAIEALLHSRSMRQGATAPPDAGHATRPAEGR